MGKIKKLWGYAVFRWAVYQTPLLVFGILASSGVFDSESRFRFSESWTFGRDRLSPYSGLFWFLIFALPAVWVWRKPIWSNVRLTVSSLNQLSGQSVETSWNYQKAVIALLLLIAFFAGWIALNLEFVTFNYAGFKQVRISGDVFVTN